MIVAELKLGMVKEWYGGTRWDKSGPLLPTRRKTSVGLFRTTLLLLVFKEFIFFLFS
jgi:hypothetical protein